MWLPFLCRLAPMSWRLLTAFRPTFHGRERLQRQHGTGGEPGARPPHGALRPCRSPVCGLWQCRGLELRTSRWGASDACSRDQRGGTTTRRRLRGGTAGWSHTACCRGSRLLFVARCTVTVARGRSQRGATGEQCALDAQELTGCASLLWGGRRTRCPAPVHTQVAAADERQAYKAGTTILEAPRIRQ